MRVARRHLARRHLKRLQKMPRKNYHPLIHKIHKKHHISKKTLFYVKEYGPHSNVPRTIIRESIRILLFASVISSIGGFALENIKYVFVSILPLVILLPVLNDMIGNYGTIFSSRFSTMLHEGMPLASLKSSRELRELFAQVLIISVLMSLLSSAMALSISIYSGYPDVAMASRIFIISLTDVVILVSLLFFVSVTAGIHFYKKGEDPNNFLIPITTSVADFGNMIILSALIMLMF